MDFPRWLCVLTVAVTALITGAASAATAGSNPAAPSVYYVRQTVSSGPDAGDEQTLSSYYEATLQAASRAGTQLLLAPIWSHQVDAAGHASYLMDLDPNDATEAAHRDRHRPAHRRAAGRHYRWSSVPTTWTFPMRE